MKKENFVSMILGVIGVILFALGMCMCLLPEWGAFEQGVVLGVVGIIILLVMLIVRRKMLNKPAITMSPKLIGKVLYGIFGALVLGTGMCMTMVWKNMLVWGIIVGIIGIVMLMALIPMCKGLQSNRK